MIISSVIFSCAYPICKAIKANANSLLRIGGGRGVQAGSQHRTRA